MAAEDVAMDFTPVASQWPMLGEAALSTLAISGISYVLGLVVGMAVCLARLSALPGLRAFGRIYVSFFRGVPLIVQLLLVYYILPGIGLNVEPVTAAVIALSACTAAYIAEIFRGGFAAVPAGQREAALTLGLTPGRIRQRIELPQILRLVWPALVNDLVLLIKVSSLISVVGVFELTRASQNIAAATFQPIPAYLAAAAAYLVIVLSVAAAAKLAEARLGRWAPEANP